MGLCFHVQKCKTGESGKDFSKYNSSQCLFFFFPFFCLLNGFVLNTVVPNANEC